MFIPCIVYGQGTDTIPSMDESLEKIKQLPIAYQRIFIDVMNNVEIKEGSMTYILPSGETVSSSLGDTSGSDTFWERIYEANKITEICNVPFGSSHEKTKAILEEKYGDFEYLFSKKDDIIYKHKKYAGVDFDSMHFLFQSDGTRSYFNAAWLCPVIALSIIQRVWSNRSQKKDEKRLVNSKKYCTFVSWKRIL